MKESLETVSVIIQIMVCICLFSVQSLLCSNNAFSVIILFIGATFLTSKFGTMQYAWPFPNMISSLCYFFEVVPAINNFVYQPAARVSFFFMISLWYLCRHGLCFWQTCMRMFIFMYTDSLISVVNFWGVPSSRGYFHTFFAPFLGLPTINIAGNAMVINKLQTTTRWKRAPKDDYGTWECDDNKGEIYLQKCRRKCTGGNQ